MFGRANVIAEYVRAYGNAAHAVGNLNATYSIFESSKDPEARRQELEVYYDQLQSPFRTAERFGVQDIIDPRDTRPILCDWVEQAYQLLPEQLGPRYRTMRV